jgi:uncharacterized protein (TIGR02246 family)
MENDVQTAADRLADALRRGDVVAAGALYADESRLLTPQADVVCGRLQIEAYWRAGLALGLVGVELEPTEIEVGSETAVEIGRYRLAVTADGGAAAVHDAGNYVAFHRRQADGSWLRAVDVFNSDAPKPACLTSKEER